MINMQELYMNSIRINEDRLWSSIMEMGCHGALPGGGCCRLALTREDKMGRDLFVRWAKEAGCAVSVDQVGNVYARRDGQDPDLPAVATGSHLDTQPHGGRFDGIYGVLAGLEAVRTLNDNNVKTRKPVDVIVWTNEEAARFPPPLTGSQVFSGKLTTEDVHRTVTNDGATVKDDLMGIGYYGRETPGSRKLDSFIEAHIEQGPVLEKEAKTIGVVDCVQGAFAAEVTLAGEDGHAGTVQLDMRRDACLGAAEMIVWLNRLATDTDDLVKMTVGTLKISPNSMSTIPGQAYFTVDCRHPDPATLSSLLTDVRTGLAEIADKRHLGFEFRVLLKKQPVKFDRDIVSVIEQSTKNLEYPYKRMLSGAGHDAMNIAELAPTGMIFIPCRNGISHNEAEYASSSDVAAGANVLLHSMIELAGMGT